MKRLFPLLLIILISGSLYSCSEEKEAKMLSKGEATEMIVKIVDNDTTRILPMARMLNTTKDSIEGVMSNNIEINNSFLQRASQLGHIYEKEGESYRKLRNETDPGYRWFEYILDYPWLYPWTFWISVIICLL